MAWEDRTKDDLRAIAQEHGVEVASDATKGEIIEHLEAAGVPEPGTHEVAGPQPVRPVPAIPVTEQEFRQLLRNPDLPPEQQSAPSLDQLNPHLFRGS